MLCGETEGANKEKLCQWSSDTLVQTEALSESLLIADLNIQSHTNYSGGFSYGGCLKVGYVLWTLYYISTNLISRWNC